MGRNTDIYWTCDNCLTRVDDENDVIRTGIIGYRGCNVHPPNGEKVMFFCSFECMIAYCEEYLIKCMNEEDSLVYY